MDEDELDALCRGTIDDALLFARQSGAWLVVGLFEDDDGADVIFLPLGDVELGFTPAWIVTPRGNVLPCSPERMN